MNLQANCQNQIQWMKRDGGQFCIGVDKNLKFKLYQNFVCMVLVVIVLMHSSDGLDQTGSVYT